MARPRRRWDLSDGETRARDWALPAGRLSFSAEALAESLMIHETATIPVTVTNSGGGAATFSLSQCATAGTGALPAPWLSLAPASGTLAAGEAMQISVTLDAGAATVVSLGDYPAAITLTHDTPYAAVTLPVTLTVLPRPQSYLPLVGRGIPSPGAP
jgi:hypothetical protein